MQLSITSTVLQVTCCFCRATMKVIHTTYSLKTSKDNKHYKDKILIFPMNRIVLWKESWNNDGQQLNQYQQNEQSTLILGGCCGRDHMVIGFTTILHLCNQCPSPLMLCIRIPFRQGVLDTTLCDKVCQWLVQDGGFLRFPPPIKLTTRNIVESGIKHHNPNPIWYVFSCLHLHTTLHIF
jgi:hypothetical protein